MTSILVMFVYHLQTRVVSPPVEMCNTETGGWQWQSEHENSRLYVELFYLSSLSDYSFNTRRWASTGLMLALHLGLCYNTLLTFILTHCNN